MLHHISWHMRQSNRLQEKHDAKRHRKLFPAKRAAWYFRKIEQQTARMDLLQSQLEAQQAELDARYAAAGVRAVSAMANASMAGIGASVMTSAGYPPSNS